MAEIAQAVYVGTLGTQPWLGGSDEEDEEPPSEGAVRGSVWMMRRIRIWLGLEKEDEDELRSYRLDPDAKPDPTFFDKVAGRTDQQGRQLVEVRRIRQSEFTGPFADRLRQVIAKKEANDDRGVPGTQPPDDGGRNDVPVGSADGD